MIPYGRHSVTWKESLSVAWNIKTKSLTQGALVSEFEKQVAEYVGAKYAVAVSSATAGLHLAMLALELNQESKVATSPISFVASANAILYAGLKPVFVDISRENINMNLDILEANLLNDSLIRAIVPVHFAGLPCDMSRLSKISNKKNTFVIEDAAHAFGSTYQSGENVGSCRYSDMTVFSFHPVKSITTGEGGMVTTNSHELYKKLIRLRSHGINKFDDKFTNEEYAMTGNLTNPWYYEMQTLGFNYRLTDFQSGLGTSQLSRIDSFIKRRRELANKYLNAFRDHEIISPAQKNSLETSSNHLFPIRINFSKLSFSRAELMNDLKARGIGTQVHYIPIPLHPYYSRLGFVISDVPEALSYYYEALSIPLFPKLKNSQQKRIINQLIELVS